MIFSTEECHRKLRNLNGSQQSIQHVSQWLLSYREIIPQIIEEWKREFYAVAKEQQLLLLYVANDMLQEDLRRTKGQDRRVVDTFEKILVEAIEAIFLDLHDSKIQEQTIKVLHVWKRRNVLSVAALSRLTELMEGAAGGRTPSAASANSPHPKTITPSAKRRLERKHQEESVISSYLHLKETHEKLDFYRTLKTEGEKRRSLLDQIDEELLKDIFAKRENKDSKRTKQLVPICDELTANMMASELLSDRFNKLRHAMDSFSYAQEEYQSVQSKEEGELLWELLDFQLYQIDIDETTDSVLEFRDRLSKEEKTREEFMKQLSHLKDYRILNLTKEEIEPKFEHEYDRIFNIYKEMCHIKEKIEKEKKAARQQRSHVQEPPVEDLQMHRHMNMRAPPQPPFGDRPPFDNRGPPPPMPQQRHYEGPPPQRFERSPPRFNSPRFDGPPRVEDRRPYIPSPQHHGPPLPQHHGPPPPQHHGPPPPQHHGPPPPQHHGPPPPHGVPPFHAPPPYHESPRFHQQPVLPQPWEMNRPARMPPTDMNLVELQHRGRNRSNSRERQESFNRRESNRW